MILNNIYTFKTSKSPVNYFTCYIVDGRLKDKIKKEDKLFYTNLRNDGLLFASKTFNQFLFYGGIDSRMDDIASHGWNYKDLIRMSEATRLRFELYKQHCYWEKFTQNITFRLTQKEKGGECWGWVND